MGYMLSTNAVIKDKWKKMPNSKKKNGSILGIHGKGVFQFIMFYENSRNYNI